LFVLKPSSFVLAFGLAVAVLRAAGLPSAASAQPEQINVEAGPIWSQSDAESKCPNVAKANGGVWTGQWKTTVPGRMSVCEVRFSSSHRKYIVKNVEAGPIWSQSDAERKCPQVAKANDGSWTGEWKTTVPGSMSVCELRLPLPKS
jgi:hypothetical protein